MRTTTLLAALLVAAGSTTALAQQKSGPGLPTRAAQPAHAQAARQHSPDAVAVLQGAAEAVKDGYSATVRSYFEGGGAFASMFATTEGRWSQKALSEDGQWAVRYTGQGTAPTKTEPQGFDALWLPDRVVWVDHEAQTYNVQPKGGKTDPAYQLASNPWGQAEPLATGFADALETASALEIREPAEVNGVMCDAVAIIQEPGGDSRLWYFGHEDHLPRRSELVMPDNPMLTGAIRVDFIDGLASADAVADSDWELLAPDGYERRIARAFLSPGDIPPGIKPLSPPSQAGGAPDWEVPDSEGVLVSPGSLRDKVSVLYFWGTWSPACKKATPELHKLAEEFAGKPVEIISMAFREGDPGAAVNAAREQGQTWRQVPAADDAAKVMGIRAAPSVVVLGAGGELLFRSGRPRSDDYATLFGQVRDIITRALSEGPAEQEDKNAGGGPAAKGPGEKLAPAAVTPAKPGRLKTKDD